MRPQLVSLALVQRALKQSSKDRWLNLAPIGVCGFDQQRELHVIDRQGVGGREQAAIEAQQVLAQDRRKPALVHRLPQRL